MMHSLQLVWVKKNIRHLLKRKHQNQWSGMRNVNCKYFIRVHHRTFTVYLILYLYIPKEVVWFWFLYILCANLALFSFTNIQAKLFSCEKLSFSGVCKFMSFSGWIQKAITYCYFNWSWFTVIWNAFSKIKWIIFHIFYNTQDILVQSLNFLQNSSSLKQ